MLAYLPAQTAALATLVILAVILVVVVAVAVGAVLYARKPASYAIAALWFFAAIVLVVVLPTAATGTPEDLVRVLGAVTDLVHGRPAAVLLEPIKPGITGPRG